MNLAVDANPRGLPQLSGGLLWIYRAAWWALAAGAILASSSAFFHGSPHTAVFALRLLKSVVLVGVATILHYRRQRDPVAALLALALLTWTITSSFDFAAGTGLPQLLDRCRFILFALALLLFPKGSWQPRWTRPLAVASWAVFLIGLAETLHRSPTRVFLPLAILCILGGIGSLIARFRLSPDYAVRQQLKWVALGLVAGVGLILCARAGFAASPRLVVWEAMFQLGIIVVALGFLISLLRYRLFDAETVISRSAAYATLTLALVATFGGSEALIQNIGQDYLGMNLGSVSGGMAAAVAAVLLNPLHERITRWAEARFQPDLTYLKRELPDLVARFATSSSTRRLSKAALPLINNAVHATHSALVVDGKVEGACGITLEDARGWAVEYLKPGYSDRDETDRIFPLRLNLGLVAPDAAALLVLGPRPDGTLCGKEDLDAVRSILPAFRDAIMMTVSRETLDAAIDRRESSLRIEIVGINARLDALESSAIDPRVRGERYQAR